MVQSDKTVSPLCIIGDDPATDNLLFGFNAYADTLAGLLANRENSTPMVMAVHGSWGSGKTTLMRAIERRLDDGGLVDQLRYRRCKTVWFNPWKYDDDNLILAGLVETIFKTMAAQGFFTLARDKVESVLRRIDQSKIFASVSKLVSGVDISEYFSELPNKDRLRFYDTFHKCFDDLVWTFLNWRFKLKDQLKPDDKKGALVILIDDLDRCPAGRIVKVLETIKLFMHRSGFIFVLAGDHTILQDAAAKRYGKTAARQWLEKMIQFAFHLPPVSVDELGALFEGQNVDRGAVDRCLPLLTPALGHNPRRIKRFVNHMLIVQGLLHKSDVPIVFDKVLCWGIIQHSFVELAAAVQEQPQLMLDLIRHIRRLNKKHRDKPIWKTSERQLKADKIPAALFQYIRQPHLAELVLRCGMSDNEFNWLRSMCRTVRVSGSGTDATGDEIEGHDTDPGQG